MTQPWGSRDLRRSNLDHQKHVQQLPVQPDFAEVDLALREELKLLYVAVTRARRRVIVFDDCREGRRIPFFELLVRRGLGNIAAVEDLTTQDSEKDWMDEETQNHQWVSRGEDLLKVGTVGACEEAAKCFRRGGSQTGEFQAMARICELRVSELKGQQLDDAAAERKRDSEVKTLLFQAGYCFVKCGLVKDAYKCFSCAVAAFLDT